MALLRRLAFLAVIAFTGGLIVYGAVLWALQQLQGVR